jgi:hypothetical protein
MLAVYPSSDKLQKPSPANFCRGFYEQPSFWQSLIQDCGRKKLPYVIFAPFRG